jgi:hypothetical protein
MTLTEGQMTILVSKIWQDVYTGLVDPERVVSRLALYESSEAKGRHTEAEMSILRYALAGYITGIVGQIESNDVIVDPVVDPYDDQVDISWDNDAHEITVEYPAWLSDFFSSDARFDYLKPDNTVVLMAVLEDMRLFAAAHYPPSGTQLPLEVGKETTDAEADAAQGPDTGGEQADSETDAEADPNPEGDLGRY